MPRPSYDYRHRVSFEETNLTGNVYYLNHLRWQGRCRELFLKEKAPETLGRLSHGLCLVTVRCSCEYFAELTVADEVEVRMRFDEIVQNRISMTFEVVRNPGGAEELVARGGQVIACMQREGGELRPESIPADLRDALRPYSEA